MVAGPSGATKPTTSGVSRSTNVRMAKDRRQRRSMVKGRQAQGPRRSWPLRLKICRRHARVADQISFGRDPPDFVRVEFVDQLPVESAFMMMDPDPPAAMLRQHQ